MFKQVELNYGFADLEPKLDALTMETHYSKHHAGYTKNLNDLVAKADLEGKSIEEILSNLDKIDDETLRKGIRNNGGGYYNHNLYFSTISPKACTMSDEFKKIVEDNFGSVEEMLDLLTKTSIGQFGSGWGWLSTDKAGKLYISSTGNQDNPFNDGSGHTPIAAVDVWEHAYYLHYKNLRADYVKAYIETICWKAVENNYKNAIK